MKVRRRTPAAGVLRLGLGLALTAMSLPAFSGITLLSRTDFNTFTPGVSVDGQGGWGIGFGAPVVTADEEIAVESPGNLALRISNAVGSGSLGDMPFAPRPAGMPTDPVDVATNPVLGQPGLFAGESSTMAQNRRFYASFQFKSVTGTPQADLAVSVSPDSGGGSRMGFVRIVDSGSGIDLVTFDVDAAGNFVGPQTIASGLSYTAWHRLAFEIMFQEGPANDIVKIFLDNTVIHTGTSWEAYYPAAFPGVAPLGVPVQTLVFSAGTSSIPGNNGGGFYFDDFMIEVGSVPPNSIPTLSQWAQILLLLGILGVAGWNWRNQRT